MHPEEGEQTFFELVNLGKAMYGSVVESTVVIENAMAEPFTILSAVSSCSCMTSQIEEKEVATGETAIVRVRFVIEGRSLSRISQQLRVKCRGALSMLELMFQVIPTDVIAFQSSEFSIVVTAEKSSSDLFQFAMPILASDPTDIKQLAFEFDEASSIKSVTAKLLQDRPIAEVEIDPVKLNKENTTGKIAMITLRGN